MIPSCNASPGALIADEQSIVHGSADAAPCCGRYADTEICRNLSDECRYNMLPTIAEKLGYSTATNGTMWRDAALVALNEVHMPQCSMSD